MSPFNYGAASSRSWVEPATPIQPAQFLCSALENLCAHVYPTPALFFDLQPGHEPTQHYENLRRGLARVLCEMPHLAGVLKSDSRGYFSVTVPEAPAAGVQFYYRDISEDDTTPSFETLREANFPFADGNTDGLAKLRPDPFPSCVDGDPVMILQLTHLRGGLVLTSSITHLVADLVQPNKFHERWAAHTRDIVNAVLYDLPEPCLPSSVAPELMDRSQLTPTTPEKIGMNEVRRLSKSLQDWKLLDPEQPQELLETISNLVPKSRLIMQDLHNQTSEENLRRPTVGVWRFSSGHLKSLHNSVLDEISSGQWLSVVDVLTALLWQRYFIAKYVPDEKSNVEVPLTTRIIYAGDVRQRLNPPLPAGFLGAAVDLIHVEIPSASISSAASSVAGSVSSSRTPSPSNSNSRVATMPMYHLARIGTKIRQANSSWSSSAFDLVLRLSVNTPAVPAFVPRGPFDLIVTDHTRAAAVIGADWGHGLGQPRAYREPYIGRNPPMGEITFLAKASNGDIEVMIAGETVVMQRLAADKEMEKAGAKFLWLMGRELRTRQDSVHDGFEIP